MLEQIITLARKYQGDLEQFECHLQKLMPEELHRMLVLLRAIDAVQNKVHSLSNNLDREILIASGKDTEQYHRAMASRQLAEDSPVGRPSLKK